MKQLVVDVQKVIGVSAMLAFSASLFPACTGNVGKQDSEEREDKQPEFEDDKFSDPPPAVEVIDESGKVVGTKPTFACKQDAVPRSVGLRKLIASQYKNTLRDVFTRALGGDAGEAMKVMSEIAPALAKYPAEERAKVAESLHGTYRQLDQDIQQAHVLSSYEIATQAAARLVEGGRLAKLAGSCATDSNTSNDAACINDFIKKFGELALRRPLEAEDVSFYRDFYGDSTGIDPLGFIDVITGLLSAPQFLYMVEHGDKAVANKSNAYELSSYELASRLAYHFTQTMPDLELTEAAKAGTLTSEGEYLKQVDRLMNDSRTRNASQEFFSDYLRVEDLPQLDMHADKKDFKAMFSDVPVTNMLRQNMMSDAVDMFQYFTWNKPGTVRDALTTEKSGSSPESVGVEGEGLRG